MPKPQFIYLFLTQRNQVLGAGLDHTLSPSVNWLLAIFLQP